MQQERIWILLAKKLAGEISPEEFKELDDLLKKDPDAGIAEQIISALWKSEIPENKNAAEEAFTRLLQRKARKEQNLNSHFYNLKKKR